MPTMKTKIVIEIAHTMRNLHVHGIIHRNLNVENIRLNSVYQTKLTDSETELPGYSLVQDLFT